MLNLIICRLSIAGLVILYFGATQSVFNIGESIALASLLLGGLVYSITEG